MTKVSPIWVFKRTDEPEIVKLVAQNRSKAWEKLEKILDGSGITSDQFYIEHAYELKQPKIDYGGPRLKGEAKNE